MEHSSTWEADNTPPWMEPVGSLLCLQESATGTYTEPVESNEQSCASSVGIVLGNGLDDRGSRVRFPAGAGNFSLHNRVQNGSGAHPASYPMGTRGSFSGGKATWAWSWLLTSI
jgi:hypothetical protein